MKLEEAKEKFVNAWGTLGNNWGINRTMAQVHALLLVSAGPLSAEDIMAELNISRGNANMNIRELINWGLVYRKHQSGQRKEFFEAEKDIWKVAKVILIERKKRELDPVFKILAEVGTVEESKKDPDVKNMMVATKELDGKEISDKTSDGKVADNIVVLDKKPVEDPGTGTITTSGPSQPDFVAEEKDPQFPGGQEALKQFLARNLGSPGDLEEGEKKVVKVKFKVEKDGSVTALEIVSSGGNDFDREVVRVCKKMPRWIPAVQNGINVPVSYVLPVTFIGTEE